MVTNVEPHKGVNFLQSSKIGTQENKAIHSIFCVSIESMTIMLSCLSVTHRRPLWIL